MNCEGCPAKIENRCALFDFENAVIACPDFTLIYYREEMRGEKKRLIEKVISHRGLTGEEFKIYDPKSHSG